MAEEDSREDLETESRDLGKVYERAVADAKAFKAQMESLEKDTLKELAARDEANGKNDMLIAANRQGHTVESMSKELVKMKTQRDFDKKKAAFQSDLAATGKAMGDRPKLLDEWEKQVTVCRTAATNLEEKVGVLQGLFRQVSEEAGKLNARIKTFNDSLTTLKKIPPLEILTPELEEYPPRLKEIKKKLDKDESEISENRKEHKGSEKELKETTARLKDLKFGAKLVKK